MEKIEWKDISRETLGQNNIFGLRDLARRAGVSSPTILKKEALIEAILSIKEGATPQPPQKRGPKPKERTVAVKEEPAVYSEQSPMPIVEQRLAELTPCARNTAAAEAPQSADNTAKRTYVPQQGRILNRTRPERRPFSEEDVSIEDCEERSGILEILPDGYGF